LEAGIYSEIGYNLKATDLQAALGLSQLRKLPSFVERRRKNFHHLHSRLSQEPKIMSRLELPEATSGTHPSWFGFPLRCLPGLSRRHLTQALEAERVGTRVLFAGNITQQPAFQRAEFRIPEPLINSDQVMNQVFWIGVHPSLGEQELDYMADKLVELCT
jgi:CDP-4-dehydro-6-deoxyglucose reductase, E1